ncbi:MAG: type II toxin-antitoxin system YafQ family toxin [Gemmatimonadota bacterium]|nr:type II toxin-antitoxin system YafQ family toxin [Gemmatimonadota bacterium]MDE2872822.1 type II toxin-antitoxin system YafQ family toxin [Gemmatimonadota bacterium]
MRTIERTSRFKRDYKRESRGRHRTYLDTILAPVVEALADDRRLEPRHHDHALGGEWGDHRDCHVKPDLLLIYRKSGADILCLVRLGSHAELGP